MTCYVLHLRKPYRTSLAVKLSTLRTYSSLTRQTRVARVPAATRGKCNGWSVMQIIRVCMSALNGEQRVWLTRFY